MFALPHNLGMNGWKGLCRPTLTSRLVASPRKDEMRVCGKLSQPRPPWQGPRGPRDRRASWIWNFISSIAAARTCGARSVSGACFAGSVRSEKHSVRLMSALLNPTGPQDRGLGKRSTAARALRSDLRYLINNLLDVGRHFSSLTTVVTARPATLGPYVQG